MTSSPEDYIKRDEPEYSANSQGYNTLFHHVCATAHPELVETLIAKGDIDVNFRNQYGQTPLHFATIHQLYYKKEIILILIKNGADINIKDEEGYSVLHTISDITYLRRFQHPVPSCLDVSIIEYLLKLGADHNTLNKLQETPLMSTAKSGDLKAVKQFLDFGANVHLRNQNLETCLHIASGSDRLNKRILEELITYGACFYCFNLQGKTALDLIHLSNKPNRLRYAKALIKMTALVKWESLRDFFILEKFNCFYLNRYCCDCVEEIQRMKSVAYSENFTLCHFALRGYNSKQCQLSEESILNKVLVSLSNRKFPIYHGTIRKHFSLSNLHQILSTRFYVKIEGNKYIVSLNEDILREISLYLKDKDVFNLAIACANVVSSQINKNEKKVNE